MSNRAISAGSLRQHVQSLWRGFGPWWLLNSSQKRRTVAPLHTHPCIRNRHENWFELRTPASSFQFLASLYYTRSIGSNARDMKRGVGSWVHSTRELPDKKDSSAHDKGVKWRKDFMEKQAEVQKKFDNVKPPPAIKSEDWWTPDPMTGVYVPESCHGCVTTAPRRRRTSSAPRERRTSSRKDQDQKAPWFDNMEELPDMDRHNKK